MKPKTEAPEGETASTPDSAVCKFRCTHVTQNEYGFEPLLQAQYDESLPEDRRFSKATPSGSLTMSVNNENLKGFFVPGQCYILEIRKAD